jgi:hypothetical protein
VRRFQAPPPAAELSLVANLVAFWGTKGVLEGNQPLLRSVTSDLLTYPQKDRGNGCTCARGADQNLSAFLNRRSPEAVREPMG